jgi:hypothetical protein
VIAGKLLKPDVLQKFLVKLKREFFWVRFVEICLWGLEIKCLMGFLGFVPKVYFDLVKR